MTWEVVAIWPQYNNLWDEYRTEFLSKDTAWGDRKVHVLVSHTVYHYYRYKAFFMNSNEFRGQFLSKIKAWSVWVGQKQQIYDNILKDLKLKDKDLYKVITTDITKLDIDVKTEHSKRNKKITTDPQTTDFSNIPYTPGEDMIGETYGRSQLVKQQKKDLKKLTTEETEGRRIMGADGSVKYEPTFDKEVGDRDTDRKITVEGDRMFLGRLINIVEKLEWNPTEIINDFAFLFVGVYAPQGKFIITKLGRKKWIPYTREEIEEEQEETQPTKKKKKATDDIADLSWSEYQKLKEENKPVAKSYYLERIIRYRARKEKEKAPIGSLTGLAIDKQKELADGLIKAWSDDPIIPDLDKFDEVMSGVMGYEEFKSQLRIYIINLAENLEQGIYELPDEMKTVFVLLGKPGTGKSFISEMLSVATGWYLINIDLGGRKDTEILEGTTPAVKGAFAGRLCQGFATGKQRMPIVLLDEFEKVAGEGLNMMLGNVLDIKKNKNWQDQFLGFEVDISNAIYLATANYADQVPDFVQDRAKFINIPLYTYAQRLKYVMGMLKKKLSKDPLTSKYADQLTENFCKLIITETWGLRQTNMNMSELVKQLRGYAILAKKGKGHAIEDITKYEKLEITPTRFNLKYPHHLRVDFNRVRTVDAEYESDGKTIKGYTWLGNLEEAEWPDFYTTDPTIFKMPPKQTITK